MPDETATQALPRRDNRRQKLLDAAAGLFRRHGFHATSMRDIARHTGMLHGSMYYHFPSKEELLVTVYEEGIKRIAAHVDGAVERESDPWRRLEAASVAHLEMLLDHSDYAQVVIRVLPGDAENAASRLIALRDGYEDRFRRLIDDLDLPPGADRQFLRLFLIGALNWSQTWYRRDGAPPRVIARRFLDFLRRPLQGEEPPA